MQLALGPTAEELSPSIINSALAQQNKGNFRGAIADYDKAIQLNPDDASAYIGRGWAKYNLGDRQGAIANYTKAMSLATQQGNKAAYVHAQNNLKPIYSRLS